MSLEDRRRLLCWASVKEALQAAGLDEETRNMVEQAHQVDKLMQHMTRMLLDNADTKQVKNYIKFEMVGLTTPFARVYVELIREGGKTSHDCRELLRKRLEGVRGLLLDEGPKLREALWEGMLAGIDETLSEVVPDAPLE